MFANPMAGLVISAPFWMALGCLLAPVPGLRGTTAPTAPVISAADETKVWDARQST
jgi:hypothetical protein